LLESGQVLANEEIEKVCKNFEYVKGGRLKYSEFIYAVIDKKRILDEERLYMAFKYFDLNNENIVTRENVMKLLDEQNSPIQENELDSFMPDGKQGLTY